MSVNQTLREAAGKGIHRFVVRSEQEYISISRTKSSLRKMTKQYPNFHKRQYGFYSDGESSVEIFFETVGSRGVPKDEACILYADNEKEAEETGEAVVSFVKDVLKDRVRIRDASPQSRPLQDKSAEDLSSLGIPSQHPVKKVYISGPITGKDGFLEAFAEAEDELKARGYSPINPAKVNHELPEDMEYGDYMRMSLTMMSFCDSVYMMKGWEESRGAKFEKNYAEMCGKKILYQKS